MTYGITAIGMIRRSRARRLLGLPCVLHTTCNRCRRLGISLLQRMPLPVMTVCQRVGVAADCRGVDQGKRHHGCDQPERPPLFQPAHGSFTESATWQEYVRGLCRHQGSPFELTPQAHPPASLAPNSKKCRPPPLKADGRVKSGGQNTDFAIQSAQWKWQRRCKWPWQ